MNAPSAFPDQQKPVPPYKHTPLFPLGADTTPYKRITAEGVRDIFSLLHATIRKHGQQQQTVRLRNAWVNVDPRAWRTRDDMTIHVALGSGGKAPVTASHETKMNNNIRGKPDV